MVQIQWCILWENVIWRKSIIGIHLPLFFDWTRTWFHTPESAQVICIYCLSNSTVLSCGMCNWHIPIYCLPIQKCWVVVLWWHGAQTTYPYCLPILKLFYEVELKWHELRLHTHMHIYWVVLFAGTHLTYPGQLLTLLPIYKWSIKWSYFDH